MPRFTPVQAVKASLYSGLATAIGAFIMSFAYFAYYYNSISGDAFVAFASFGYLIEVFAGLLFFAFIIAYFALAKKCEYTARKKGVQKTVGTAVALSILAAVTWLILWIVASIFFGGGTVTVVYAFVSALAMFIGITLLNYCSCLNCFRVPFWLSVAALIVSLPLTFIGIALDAIAFAVALKNIGTLGKA